MGVGTSAIVGDIGTLIKVDMRETMVGATGLNFEVERADGSKVDWVPTINGNFLQYTTLAGDLNSKGKFIISPQFINAGGFNGRANPVVLLVRDKYEIQ